MSAALNNVVGLNQGTVYGSIRAFLNKLSLKSQNTALSYERSIRRFFMWHCGTEIEVLKPEQLDITNDKMIAYQYYLANDEDLDYSNATVNAYTSPIMSLYDHLSRNRYPVRVDDVKLDMLPNDDGESYGELSVQEAETMAKLSLKQKKGQEKSSLIRMAYTTSFRKGSLLKIKWADIKFDPRNQCYLVTGLGKGKKKHTRPISVDLYNEILKIKEQKYYTQYTDDFIFHLDDKTILHMMQTLRQEMGFSKDDNIVFHSFRNVAAGYIKETGGSIEEIREQLNHTGYGALKHYMHKDKDYANMAGITMNEKIDTNIIGELTREELLQVIFQQSEGAILVMQREAKKIIENRESGK